MPRNYRSKYIKKGIPESDYLDFFILWKREFLGISAAASRLVRD